MNNQIINKDDLIVVGEIVKCQGIKGDFKVVPLTDDVERFAELKRVFFETTDGFRALQIKNFRTFKQFILLKFEGIDDLTAAESLGRGYIYILLSERRKLPPGRYYYDELEGLSVETIDGEQLGVITTVLTPGANDVYVVKGTRGEILIPALKHVVKQVDLTEHKMLVELPEGLLE